MKLPTCIRRLGNPLFILHEIIMHDTSLFTTSIGCRIWSSEGWLKVSHTGHGSINRLTSFKASMKSSDLIHFIEETPKRLINISSIRNFHKATNYCRKPSSWKLVPLCHKTCLKEINPGGFILWHRNIFIPLRVFCVVTQWKGTFSER